MCSTWSDWILVQPGFPNRKSPDQSVFAAPRSFSQLVTSFIAWCRQGIHLLLLPICFISLTTLQMNEVWSGACITHKRSSTVKEHRFPKRNQKMKSSRPGVSLPGDAASLPGQPGLHDGWLVGTGGLEPPTPRLSSACSNQLSYAPHSAKAWPLSPPNSDLCHGGEGWWSQTGSNRRPPECKSGALPTELWPRKCRFKD